MTPDGITEKEWGKVKELAAKIANASLPGQEIDFDKYQDKLLHFLDELENKYGELPSILATRADYVADASTSIVLLEKAYKLAKSRNDVANLTYIASSIAETYVERLSDFKTAQYWINELEKCLGAYFDEDEFQTLQTLRKALSKN